MKEEKKSQKKWMDDEVQMLKMKEYLAIQVLEVEVRCMFCQRRCDSVSYEN